LSAKLSDIIHLENDSTFRYPIHEIITIIFVFVSLIPFLFLNPLVSASYTTEFPLNTTQIALENSEDLEMTLYSVTQMYTYSIASMIALIVPLLIAFTFAQSFDDGSFRTLLSYPISRQTLLFSRLFLVVIPIGVTLTSFFIIGSLVSFWSSLHFSFIVLVIIGIWIYVSVIVSVCILIACISRKSITTAFTGMLIWFLFPQWIFNMYELPKIIRALSNPLLAMSSLLSPYSTDFVVGDIIGSYCILFLITIIMIISSLLVFRQVEIN
jgi:ABC-type transport system involved in multi-copper enzyme maturation permease subunit